MKALAPFHVPQAEGQRFQSAHAAALLRQAKEAEEKALSALESIMKAL